MSPYAVIPGYFFPILPSKHCSKAEAAAAASWVPWERTFPALSLSPGRTRREADKRSHQSQREAHGGVGLFRNVVPRRECRLFIPITGGTKLGSSWLLRLQTRKCGVSWEAKAWLGSQDGENNIHVLSRNEDEREGP